MQEILDVIGGWKTLAGAAVVLVVLSLLRTVFKERPTIEAQVKKRKCAQCGWFGEVPVRRPQCPKCGAA